MKPFTLNQAAKAAKRAKSTLLEAIRAGRLSASKNELGHYQIEPAELFRVYPPTEQEPVLETTQKTTDRSTNTDSLDKISLLERMIAGLENERDDLRRRLDIESEERRSAAAEIRRLTLLLTHDATNTDEHKEPVLLAGFRRFFGGSG